MQLNTEQNSKAVVKSLAAALEKCVKKE